MSATTDDGGLAPSQRYHNPNDDLQICERVHYSCIATAYNCVNTKFRIGRFSLAQTIR